MNDVPPSVVAEKFLEGVSKANIPSYAKRHLTRTLKKIQTDLEKKEKKALVRKFKEKVREAPVPEQAKSWLSEKLEKVEKQIDEAGKPSIEKEIKSAEKSLQETKKEIVEELGKVPALVREAPPEERKEIIKSAVENLKTLSEISWKEESLRRTKKQIEELKAQGYKFKPTEEGWIVYKPLTQEEKRILTGYKLAEKKGLLGSTLISAGALVTYAGARFGLPVFQRAYRGFMGEIEKAEKEVEKDFEKTPSFEELKARYYAKTPPSYRLASSFGWSMIKTAGGIVTFPEFVAEEGFGRLYTWVTKGKPERVEIVPISEKIYREIGKQTPRTLTPGLIEASFSAMMKRSTNEFSKLTRQPAEAFMATLGEALTFWSTGKFSSAVTRSIRKFISSAKVTEFKVVEAGEGVYKLKPKPSLKNIFKFREGKIYLNRFRQGQVKYARDYYGFLKSEGVTFEKTAGVKAGVAKVKPGEIAVGTERMILERSKPFMKIEAVETYSPKEFLIKPYRSFLQKMELGKYGRTLISTGVKGKIFRKAYVFRMTKAGAGKVGKPLGGILVHEKGQIPFAKASFESIARQIAFPVRNIGKAMIKSGMLFSTKFEQSMKEISMPTISKKKETMRRISMPDISKYKPRMPSFGMPDLSKFEHETAIDMTSFSTDLRNSMRDFGMGMIGAGMLESSKAMSNISTELRRIAMSNINRIDSEVRSITRTQQEQTEQTFEKMQREMSLASYSYSFPKIKPFGLKMPAPEMRKKKPIAISFKMPKIEFGYKEFYHPVRWLF